VTWAGDQIVSVRAGFYHSALLDKFGKPHMCGKNVLGIWINFLDCRGIGRQYSHR
jgi:hypothetical protein